MASRLGTTTAAARVIAVGGLIAVWAVPAPYIGGTGRLIGIVQLTTGTAIALLGVRFCAELPGDRTFRHAVTAATILAIVALPFPLFRAATGSRSALFGELGVRTVGTVLVCLAMRRFERSVDNDRAAKRWQISGWLVAVLWGAVTIAALFVPPKDTLTVTGLLGALLAIAPLAVIWSAGQVASSSFRWESVEQGVPEGSVSS